MNEEEQLEESGIPDQPGVGRKRMILAVAALAAVFHLYGAGVAPFTALVQRPIHLALMATLAFLGVGVRSRPGSRVGWGINWALGIVLVASCLYLVSENEALVARSGNPTALDLVGGAVTVACVLLLAKRATGWGLVVVATGALLYALLGPWLPGILAHRGYGPQRLIEQLFLSTEGIWGVPLGVSADFVYLFVLFGAFLDVAGGGALLIGLADRIAGRTRGGPAKTAAVASAFMGSLSGSAVANVVTTGTFTIPLMRRSGFKPFFAGAIEAAASTGGQLMPPVMGAGAFILATWTNIPYGRVALAAAIPAILYYTALLWAIHFRACQVGLQPSRGDQVREVMSKIHLLLPVVVIVLLLAQGRSPMRAAFWGVISSILVSYARATTRPNWGQITRSLRAGAHGSVQVAAACAAAGIVVGVASLTGIGLRMSELIVVVSQGNLLAALVLTALGSIVLGMGLPTTAAYVVLAALGAPALVELGVPLLGAHLFIFYFGCISNVTPPVSLAAYAAAGIADSPPLKTAWTAMGLASAGFLVPFMFIYAPPLLLEGSAIEIARTAVTGVLGVTALAGAVIGFMRAPLGPVRRAMLGAAAVALIHPSLLWDAAGLVFLVVGGLLAGPETPGPDPEPSQAEGAQA
ncbi:MAG: TRAP transporter fused permease subunit [Gemmatimonadetes bacterium]|nr:TRAP transporter fused permease subunit [Gemmatimonadota bacterium]